MNPDPGKRSAFRRWWMPALGYALSAASLVWVFRGFNLQQTLADFATLDWRYVSIAVLLDLSVCLPVSHVEIITSLTGGSPSARFY